MAAEWGGGRERRGDALQRAERLAERLPARERMLIGAAAARHRGDVDTAEQQYRRVTEHTAGWTWVCSLLKAELLAPTGNKRAAVQWLASATEALQPFPSYVYLRLAQLSDELGDTAAAAASYDSALLHLSDADAGLSAVVDAARARLAALRLSRQ